jgi:hypothetical protein
MRKPSQGAAEWKRTTKGGERERRGSTRPSMAAAAVGSELHGSATGEKRKDLEVPVRGCGEGSRGGSDAVVAGSSSSRGWSSRSKRPVVDPDAPLPPPDLLGGSPSLFSSLLF